jgi:SAM-dependent methyltransferase
VCCDSAFLRGVYHHLTRPDAIDASLYRALKPGGKIAVIDFAPKLLLSWLFPVHGVPRDRGGHGVLRDIVVRELQNAGFRIEQQIERWPKGQYCIVATRP